MKPVLTTKRFVKIKKDNREYPLTFEDHELTNDLFTKLKPIIFEK